MRGFFVCGCNLVQRTLGDNVKRTAEYVLFFELSFMPVSSPRPCSYHACRNLVKDGSGRCADHPKLSWAKKANATKRITGRRLQAMRAKLFSSNPLCAECARNGLVAIATQRDHIIPLEEGGLDDDTNEQGLCDACHEKKSKQESQRGRWGRAGQKSSSAQRKPTV